MSTITVRRVSSSSSQPSSPIGSIRLSPVAASRGRLQSLLLVWPTLLVLSCKHRGCCRWQTAGQQVPQGVQHMCCRPLLLLLILQGSLPLPLLMPGQVVLPYTRVVSAARWAAAGAWGVCEGRGVRGGVGGCVWSVGV